MDIRELQQSAKREIERLENIYGTEKDKEKDSWAYALKVGEEFGEVCDSLLSAKGYQRPNKEKSKVSDELADLLFSTIVLATFLEIDLESALEKKRKK